MLFKHTEMVFFVVFDVGDGDGERFNYYSYYSSLIF